MFSLNVYYVWGLNLKNMVRVKNKASNNNQI